MKEPRIKQVEPPMKMANELPIDTATIDDAPEVEAMLADPEQAEPTWPQPIDTAPKDGALVIVAKGGVEQRACWYVTRVRNPRERCWDVTGWWIDPLTRQKLLFEPTEWRPSEGFATQAMAS